MHDSSSASVGFLSYPFLLWEKSSFTVAAVSLCAPWKPVARRTWGPWASWASWTREGHRAGSEPPLMAEAPEPAFLLWGLCSPVVFITLILGEVSMAFMIKSKHFPWHFKETLKDLPSACPSSLLSLSHYGLPFINPQTSLCSLCSEHTSFLWPKALCFFWLLPRSLIPGRAKMPPPPCVF